MPDSTALLARCFLRIPTVFSLVVSSPPFMTFLSHHHDLHRLVWKLEFLKEEGKLEEAAKCPHHNLNYLNAVENVNYLIHNNAIALEKIVIDPIQRWAYHHNGARKSLDVMRNEREARNHAMHQLKEKVPSTTEFVCLDFGQLGNYRQSRV
ncbi:hypothetical protein M0R45_028879 [Rubus argutus]|uniref:Uncharacterized protein n=1 Tax=Rubus argutus TaxID=59490 RepID=A0AAW1WA02_RUBAR